MNNYYTSDLHLDHTNILEYEHRPYKTIEEMNLGLIDNINKTVTEKDHLWILGDFTLRITRGRVERFVQMINTPHKHLIIGNHDYFAGKVWAKDLFESIDHYKEIHDNGRKVVLCHYPIQCWNGMERGSYHLYGHIHRGSRDLRPPLTHPNAFNVGVDVRVYYPITLDDLIGNRYEQEN